MKTIRETFEEGQKHGSARSSLNQVAKTFNSIKDWKPNSRNLDIGGGKYDKATEFMKNKNVENLVFDPFNRTSDWNRKVALAIQDGGADTVTVNNVLNVIQEDEIIENIVLQAAHALKPDGIAYFLMHEGDKTGVGRITKQTKGDEVEWTWQRHQRTKAYIPFIQKYFSDVTLKNGIIIAKNPYENAQDSNWYLDGYSDDNSENNLMHIRYNRTKNENKLRNNTIKLTESQFHRVISESVKSILSEYNRWWQMEENGVLDVRSLINRAKPMLDSIESLSKKELWELVRIVAYINHSAFKIKFGMYDKYPDEMLDNKDFRLNNVVYSFKERAVKKIIEFYIENDLDVSTNEERNIIIFRDPISGARQITFHCSKGSNLPSMIARNDGSWDGVKGAHHYDNDEDYNKARFK